MFLVDRLPKEHSGSADQTLGNDSHVPVVRDMQMVWKSVILNEDKPLRPTPRTYL